MRVAYNEVNVEDDVIRELDKLLKQGGDIDATFFKDPMLYYGTMLYESIRFRYGKIVNYLLQNGADISKNFVIGGEEEGSIDFEDKYLFRPFTVFEFAITRYSQDPEKYREVYQLIKDKGLQLCSRYGLNLLHLECALGNWSEVEKHLDPSNINRPIDVESHVWPCMTPLLIAAKFDRQCVVSRLFDLGASPKCRDTKGNTPLHFLSTYKNYQCDHRFFIYEDEDTFGSYNGMSHFHIACRLSPRTLNVSNTS